MSSLFAVDFYKPEIISYFTLKWKKTPFSKTWNKFIIIYWTIFLMSQQILKLWRNIKTCCIKEFIFPNMRNIRVKIKQNNKLNTPNSREKKCSFVVHLWISIRSSPLFQSWEGISHYTLQCYKGRISTSEHATKFKGSQFLFLWIQIFYFISVAGRRNHTTVQLMWEN